MPQKGTLTRDVTAIECPWLSANLSKGREIYEYCGSTYGCISELGIAVSDQPNMTPYYEVPADAVSWNEDMFSSLLFLPVDAERVIQLQKKLNEYNQRLERYTSIGKVPETWDTICKIAVLKELLEHGRVHIDSLRRKVLQENGEAVCYLAKAFNVITDYCVTGGQNNCGGTGLPPAERLIH
jgi:hypothetical protein